ncbi:MAG: hypothetical protein KJ731_10455 [Alphaproteobacteria bacterium]|nr:hypothetical protein [Alphaproteobacteria bacterium]MBU1280225.1 hypothetical protein [Alphaproteobacteria bacterium]MBU1571573.1 hypothetical protein [Alphaproteobacteria bacterium]MBU1828877.1 hypothetical protein [Alphaproteobacteria bacterium]MBU2077403.1 hypothetical protein [Alphaproteobacteria bacterium]
MTTPEKQGKGLRNQTGRDPNALLERVAALQDRVKALGSAAPLTELEMKAFMDDQWGEGSLW